MEHSLHTRGVRVISLLLPPVETALTYTQEIKEKNENLYSNEVHLVLQCVHTYS